MGKTKTFLQMKQKREVPKELIESSREFARMKKGITNALKSGPKTVPEVAEILSKPTSEVMYWMMSMRKYELVVETNEVTDEGYYKYKSVRGRK